jgi:hypothetical protein
LLHGADATCLSCQLVEVDLEEGGFPDNSLGRVMSLLNQLCESLMRLYSPEAVDDRFPAASWSVFSELLVVLSI